MGIWVSVLGVAGLLVGFQWLRAQHRRGVIEHFRRYLSERHAGTELTIAGSRLRLRGADGSELELSLPRLTKDIFTAQAVDYEQRRPIFERGLAAAEEQRRGDRLSLETDGDRLLPRIVPLSFFAVLPQSVGELPRQPLSDTGLFVIYVVDNPQAVVYVTAKQLGQLGLTLSALHDRAVANLRRRSSEEPVREALDGHEIAMVQTLDTYDAARLLLVPTMMLDGQELIARIPNRDTLLLSAKAIPAAAVRPGPPNERNYPLLDRSIVVTHEGFRLGE